MVLTRIQRRALNASINVNRGKPSFRNQNPRNIGTFTRRRRFRKRNPTNAGRSQIINSGPSPMIRPFVSNRGGRVFNSRFMTTKLSAPASYGFDMHNAQRTTYTFTKTSLIGEVIRQRLDNGYFAFRINIHPGNMPWVRDLIKLFDKYMFTSYAVRLLPNVGTVENGATFIGFNYENHHNVANSFVDAQAYDKFQATPIWSDSSWVSVPKNILTDKWYDTTFQPENPPPGMPNFRDVRPAPGDTFHDFSPGRVIVGYSGSNAILGSVIARVEVRYTLVLSRPTLDTPVVGGGSFPGFYALGQTSDDLEAVRESNITDSVSVVSIDDT